jgi:hypothetical protein
MSDTLRAYPGSTERTRVRRIRLIVEHLPERRAEIREPATQEPRASAVLELLLDECSVKVDDGGPDDPAEDVELPVWTGRVPLVRQ